MDDKRKTKPELIRELRSLRRKIRNFENVEQERKREKEAMRWERDLATRIIQTSPSGIMLVNCRGRVTFANRRTEEVLGLAEDEITGRTYDELACRITDSEGNPLPDHRLPFQQVISTGEPLFDVRRAIERADGRRTLLSINGAPLFDKSGQMEGVLFSIEDITQRKRVEEALRLEKENFRHSLDESPLGVRIVTADGDTLYANRTILDFYGYDSLEELRKTPLRARYTPESYVEFQKRKQQRERGDFSTSEYEISIVRKNGEVLHLQVHRKEVLWNNAKQFLIMYQDITERKRAEDLLITERDLGLALSGARGLDETLCLCLEAAIRVSRMDCGGIYLVNETSGDVDLVLHKGLSSDFVQSVSHYNADSANARLVMVGKPIYGRHQELSLPLDANEYREGLRAIAIIPVHYGNRVIACLNIASHTVEEVPGYARVALEAISSQMGNAMWRSRTDEALRESEERYRSLVEAAPDVIYTISAEDGSLTSLNPAFETLTGWSRAEWLGKPFMGIVHPDDLPFAVETFQKASRGETPPLYELRVQSKSGEYLVGEFTSTPHVKGGKVVGELGIARDITERKRAEEALALLAHAIRSIGECVSITDTENKILFVNDAFLRTYGYAAEELVGKSIALVRSVAAKPAADKVLNATLQGGWQGELVNRKKDGTEFPISLSTSVVRTEKGRPLGLVGIAADITERKRVEEALRLSEQKYRDLVGNALVGVFQSTVSGDILFANDALIQMFEYANFGEFAEGKAQGLYRNPRDRERFITLLKESGRVAAFESEVLTKQGAVKTVLTSATLDGDLLSGIIRDITEPKKAEIALQAARSRLQRLSRRLLEVQENERRWLARELHDEIGQILTAAKIDLQVIRRTPVSDDLAVRLDDDIAMLDRCLRQVRNLSLDLRPSMLDDLGLVAALRWQLEHQAERVGFQARLVADDLAERLESDLETASFRIAQEALTNIVRHAKANNVEIELRICEPELLLTVRDDGVGFDVDRALADAAHGKSFGILGMQERVSLLDGKLEINSEDKRGTIVTVRLPLRLAEKREH